MSFNLENNEIKKEGNLEKQAENILSLDELISIRREIDSYNNGNTGLEFLSGKALKYIESGVDINSEIEKLEKEKEKKDRKNESIKQIQEKKKEIEDKIKDQEIKYKELDTEFERRDSAGLSTAGLGDEMSDIEKIINQLKDELKEVDEELEKETIIN